MSCGNCDHYEISSLVKHRTNDIVDARNNFIQINHDQVEYKIFKQNIASYSPFRGMLLQRGDESETNLKNAPLNIGMVNVRFWLLVFLGFNHFLPPASTDSSCESNQLGSEDPRHILRSDPGASSSNEFYPKVYN